MIAISRLFPPSHATAIVIAAGVFAASPAIAAYQKVEVLPGGTQVPIHVVGSISSSSAKPGDSFTFAASQNVVVDRRIVIRRGVQGRGEVLSANKAGGSGHSGSIGLKFNWIYAVDGGKIRLSDTAQSKAEEDRKGASSTATIIGVATFGIGGLFGHNFARGKDLTIDETKTLSAFVAHNVHVRTTDVEAADDSGDGFDR